MRAGGGTRQRLCEIKQVSAQAARWHCGRTASPWAFVNCRRPVTDNTESWAS